MPPKTEQEQIVLLINIGVTCSGMESTSSLLEKEKHIAKRIIEKKIFLRPKDEIAVILMGSAVTKNSLNTEHVGTFADFQIPNWDLVEKIMSLQATRYCSNWVESLVATVEYIRKNGVGNYTRKIILMSDFNESEDIISQFKADFIAEKLEEYNIQLISMGEESLDDRPESTLKISEVLLKDLHKQINGQYMSFDSVISDLRFYVEAPKTPTAWACNLEFFDKKIPIASYTKTNRGKYKTREYVKDDQKLDLKRHYLDRQRNTYENDEIVTGYKYGEIFVPADEKLEESMSYKSGVISYIIDSFTNRDDIDLEYWSNGTTCIVLPSAKVKDAETPFYSLVEAMHKGNFVAIVRKVYSYNCTPKMVALFPCIDVPDEPWCLVEIPLPFAEDRRMMETGPMKSVIKQLSSEQNEAVDNLLHSLMLTDEEDSDAVDGCRSFLPGCVPDPAVQYKWHALSHRVLKPDQPLPPMDDYLQELLEAPSVKEKSKRHLQRIAQLFQLERIDPKEQKKDETKMETAVQGVTDIHIEESTKVGKVVEKTDSFMESAFHSDTSDVDLDDLAANI